MNVKVEYLDENSRDWAMQAKFDEELNDLSVKYLREHGLGEGEYFASCCMKWIWSQWLRGIETAKFQSRVRRLVERGMMMQSECSLFDGRPANDLFLLHCAIFASDPDQLTRLAQNCVDVDGYRDFRPANDGNLYVCAWVGMLKYWILGDSERAKENANEIWSARKPSSLVATTKPLVTGWLGENWERFVSEQEKDFAKQWARLKKYGVARVGAEDEISVDIFQMGSLTQSWSWAHCGLALLANRDGVEVATDSFWFPPVALERE